MGGNQSYRIRLLGCLWAALGTAWGGKAEEGGFKPFYRGTAVRILAARVFFSLESFGECRLFLD